MRSTTFCDLLPVLAVLLLGTAGCNHSNAPEVKAAGKPAASPSPKAATEDDLRVARSVLTIPGVVAELRAGVAKEKVLAEVKERRIAHLMVEANELELAANGAGHELLAALKDPRNLLSPTQEQAYMQLAAQNAAHQPRISASRR